MYIPHKFIEKTGQMILLANSIKLEGLTQLELTKPGGVKYLQKTILGEMIEQAFEELNLKDFRGDPKFLAEDGSAVIDIKDLTAVCKKLLELRDSSGEELKTKKKISWAGRCELIEKKYEETREIITEQETKYLKYEGDLQEQVNKKQKNSEQLYIIKPQQEHEGRLQKIEQEKEEKISKIRQAEAQGIEELDLKMEKEIEEAVLAIRKKYNEKKSVLSVKSGKVIEEENSNAINRKKDEDKAHIKFIKSNEKAYTETLEQLQQEQKTAIAAKKQAVVKIITSARDTFLDITLRIRGYFGKTA